MTDNYKIAQNNQQDALQQRPMTKRNIYKLVHRISCGKFHRPSSLISRLSPVLCLLTSVILVVTAGCATSQNSPSANNFTTIPANDQSDLIGSDSEAEEDSFTDEEFDLLEEELEEEVVEVDDPLEGFNRLMFGVNDVLYFG